MIMPKTAKGYISMIRKIEKLSLTNLKGFNELPEKEREALITIAANISNEINEI